MFCPNKDSFLGPIQRVNLNNFSGISLKMPGNYNVTLGSGIRKISNKQSSKCPNFLHTPTCTYIGLSTGSYLVVKVSLHEAVITNCYNCVLLVPVLASSMVGTGRVDFH